MAGATNRSLKAVGFKQAAIKIIRSTGGRVLSIRSAIQHAQKNGAVVPVKAVEHVGTEGAPEGWKRVARGEKAQAKPEESRRPIESLESYRARDAASRDPVAMRQAIREQIKRVRDVGRQVDENRLAVLLQARNSAAKRRAAERGGQQDLFGVQAAPRGPSPFERRAKEAADRRAALVAAAQARAGRIAPVLGGAAQRMMAARKAAQEQNLLAPWKNTKVEGKSADHWSAEMSDLRNRKPRPLNKLYRNPALITPEIKAKHDMVMRAWNALYRRATKNHKKAMELSNAAWRKATPAQQAARLRHRED